MAFQGKKGKEKGDVLANEGRNSVKLCVRPSGREKKGKEKMAGKKNWQAERGLLMRRWRRYS